MRQKSLSPSRVNKRREASLHFPDNSARLSKSPLPHQSRPNKWLFIVQYLKSFPPPTLSRFHMGGGETKQFICKKWFALLLMKALKTESLWSPFQGKRDGVSRSNEGWGSDLWHKDSPGTNLSQPSPTHGDEVRKKQQD